MELERQIKLTKPTKNNDTPSKSSVSPSVSSIEIPPKIKLINENSAIIQRIREAEEKAKREKLSDEELIEREFREQAEAIRAKSSDLNKNYPPQNEIQSYMEQSQIPQTRNMSELDDDFSANEVLDDLPQRTPLPKNNTDSFNRNSAEKTAQKSSLDKMDLSDLMPNPPKNTAPKRGSLGLIEQPQSSEMDSLDSTQDSHKVANPAQNQHADSRLSNMKDFLNENNDNHTPHIIDDIARQENIVGIYTPDPHDLDNEFHHTVEFVDKIDNYDIQIPQNKTLYGDILKNSDIIDATDDIDKLNEINASLTRAQKRLEEKLKVAKIRQKLGDIKSITPIDSDNSPKNATNLSDEIVIDFSQTPKLNSIDFTQNNTPKTDSQRSDLPKSDSPKTAPKIDLSDLILDSPSVSHDTNLAHFTTSQKYNDSQNITSTNAHSSANLAQNSTIPTRNEILERQNTETDTKKQNEFDENFFDFESFAPPSESANLSTNPHANLNPPTNLNLTINPNSTSDFTLPPLDLLNPPYAQKIEIDDSEIDIKVQNLFNKLRVFKIEGDIVRTYSGPVVTTFEFRPAPNVKVSRIQNLQDDLSMALKATSIRIQAPIPGKDVVGIEIPNNRIQTIYLREIFESEEFRNSNANLPIALGKDVIGNPVIEDLATLPHLLIAGTTGSGKSVGINAMILSLLYRHTPKDLRFIMIDPKFLEFGLYKDIPHLLTPIITDPKKAIIALSKAVEEMNRRYELMDKAKVKTIVGFNELAKQNGEEKLPYIVIIIDEFADLMIMGGREAEQFLISLAGKARASGIHLIIATQRPTVNVVTGLIKGNLPSKISYRVGSKIDSKVILDETGAEALLGRGDMLFSKTNNIVRLHAPYNDEREIERVVDFLKNQQEVQYDEFFSLEQKEPTAPPPTQFSGEGDLKERAKEIIIQSGKTSISYLQRGLGIGFNKAASIIESLEKDGFLSPPNHKGNREIIGS